MKKIIFLAFVFTVVSGGFYASAQVSGTPEARAIYSSRP
jgi:hypothetical protein